MSLDRAPSVLPGVRFGAVARAGDRRGSFRELWRATAFEELDPVDAGGAPGTRPTFVQANLSTSATGVLRGLHCHRTPARLLGRGVRARVRRPRRHPSHARWPEPLADRGDARAGRRRLGGHPDRGRPRVPGPRAAGTPVPGDQDLRRHRRARVRLGRPGGRRALAVGPGDRRRAPRCSPIATDRTRRWRTCWCVWATRRTDPDPTEPHQSAHAASDGPTRHGTILRLPARDPTTRVRASTRRSMESVLRRSVAFLVFAMLVATGRLRARGQRCPGGPEGRDHRRRRRTARRRPTARRRTPPTPRRSSTPRTSSRSTARTRPGRRSRPRSRARRSSSTWATATAGRARTRTTRSTRPRTASASTRRPGTATTTTSTTASRMSRRSISRRTRSSCSTTCATRRATRSPATPQPSVTTATQACPTTTPPGSSRPARRPSSPTGHGERRALHPGPVHDPRRRSRRSGGAPRTSTTTSSAFPSTRTPGATAYTDTEGASSGYYRSLVARPGLTTDEVTGATYADTGTDPTTLVVPGNAAVGDRRRRASMTMPP